MNKDIKSVSSGAEVDHYARNTQVSNPEAVALRQAIQQQLKKERAKWGEKSGPRWNRAADATLVSEVGPEYAAWSRVDSAWSGLQIVPCVSFTVQGRNISKYEICMFSVERWHVTTNCLYSLWHWEADRLIKEGTGNNKQQFSSQAEACRTWFQFDTKTLIIASDVTRLFHIAFGLFVSTYPRSCGSQGSWFQMWRDVQKHLGILRENSEKQPPEMLRYFSLPRNQNANRVPSKCLHWCMGQNTLAANVSHIWQGTQRPGDKTPDSQFALLQLSACQN